MWYPTTSSFKDVPTGSLHVDTYADACVRVKCDRSTCHPRTLIEIKIKTKSVMNDINLTRLITRAS